MSSYQEKAEASGCKFSKIELGQKFLSNGGSVTFQEVTDQHIKGIAHGHNARQYPFTVDLVDGTKSMCTCGYYLPYKPAKGDHTQLCTHQLAGLITADHGSITITVPEKAERKPRGRREKTDTSNQPGQTRSQSFAAKVSRAISKGINDSIVDPVMDIIRMGRVPIMLGPTGCGKTSAAKQVRALLGYGMETVAGMESFADADLFGLRMPSRDIEGVIARAFRRARAGEKIILYIDEFYRFNSRVQAGLMNAILPVGAADARAQGIDTDKDVYICEAPVWGIEYAPVENIVWLLGANPWGFKPDTAFVRRVEAVYCTYNHAVADVLDHELRDFVHNTWAMVEAGGGLELPIEYQQIASMRGPADYSVIDRYLNKLRMLDVNQLNMVASIAPVKPIKQQTDVSSVQP